MIRTLADEGFPNVSSSIKIINKEYIKNIVILEPGLYNFTRDFQNKIIKLGLDLNVKTLISYENRINEIQRIKGVIGGHIYNIKIFDKYFVKHMAGKCLLNEMYLYYLIMKDFPDLGKFLVKCYGLIFAKDFSDINFDLIEDCLEKGRSSNSNIMFYPFDQ
jgi:hypothetical protein